MKFGLQKLKEMQGSYIITDLNGELSASCRKELLQKGYKVRTLDLIDLAGSMHYNPFAYLTSTGDIMDIAEIFTKQLMTSENPKRTEKSLYYRMFFCALFGYVKEAYLPEEQTFKKVLDILNDIDTGQLEHDAETSLDRLFDDWNDKTKGQSFAVRNYRTFKTSVSERTTKDILLHIITECRQLLTPEILEITGSDEMKLGKFGKKDTAVFILWKEGQVKYEFLMNALMVQLSAVLCKQRRNLKSFRPKKAGYITYIHDFKLESLSGLTENMSHYMHIVDSRNQLIRPVQIS